MRKGKYAREGIFGPEIDSPADELINDAWDASTPAQRIKLARAALEIDLNAIDAYNILGMHAASYAERIAIFREAVRIGERLFQPAFDEPDMAWWGFMGTRPWMRAQHNLGLALMGVGDREEAATVFQRLLALNPNDNQGIRILLLKIATESGDYDACKVLFASYEDDSSTDFITTKLLVDLATKKKVNFGHHFQAIEQTNKHILPLLVLAANGKWGKSPNVDMVAWGSKEEAAIYLHEFKAAWLRKPKLLSDFLLGFSAYQKDKKDHP